MAIWDNWAPGFSERDLRSAEERYRFQFPPDLLDFLKLRRFPHGYDWHDGFDAIERALEAPLQGILFDVEHNNIWWAEWGPRPSNKEERALVVAARFKTVPKLIPLLGHRYMPAQPHETGNPVFSVVQMDIIYYGANLINYISNEFDRHHSRKSNRDGKFVPFWSTAVERAYGPEATWNGC